MPEVKNTFLASKMNLDVDDRIIPKNEYRAAMNMQVNRSENSDVGSLQTALGNELVFDINVDAGATNLESIGHFVDTANDRVFIFLTDYTDNNPFPTYNKTAKNYIYIFNSSQNTILKIVEGAYLNFSKTNPITGVNVLEDLLFWTDNRNQPRRISISKAIGSTSYYDSEEKISVARINPVHPIFLYRESSEIGEYETTMYDVVNEDLPDGTTNPYYDPDYIGDPSYLEDKFVRFSYRFKFEQNEYSVFAPFTQVTYIPKQDGYFMYEPGASPGDEPNIDDETAAYRSSVVSFMYNKVNNILLNIKLPCNADELGSKYSISDIEILYKESNGLTVQVVDVIPLQDIILESGSSDIYVYNYQSKKPFRTLPERDLIRVNDKTPVKALSQEVVSNRIIYGNYQDKQSYPRFFNYNVVCSNKSDFDLDNDYTSIVEYPNHSVKQNRNYQVGVVLGDRFGRESGVILSNALNSTIPGYLSSSLFVPYKEQSSELVSAWPGYSLKILFNDVIDSGGVSDWPGLYNGDPDSDEYNPLGWYYYKIVVKQTEQEYYNVYLPGVMSSYPEDDTKELGRTSHAVLISDNINKVPRDLNDISDSQEQYRSSVKLYPRVINNNDPSGNEQSYPGNTFAFVNTIATNSSLFTPVNPLPSVYEQFYQIESNPLVARLSTKIELGVTSSNDVINLAVFETEPFESRLDIYWETSTAGLLEELNEAILLDNNGPASIFNWNFSLEEDFDIDDKVSVDFEFKDIIGATIPLTLSNISLTVVNQQNDDRTSLFTIINGTNPNSFSIKINDYFYYGFSANTLESYILKFQVSYGGSLYNFNRTGSLKNIVPTITNAPVGIFPAVTGQALIFDFDAVNGSNVLGGKSTEDLQWSITIPSSFYAPGPPPPPGTFVINQNGVLTNPGEDAFGNHRVLVRVTDAGGLFHEITFDFAYGIDLGYLITPVKTTITDNSGTRTLSGTIIVYSGYSIDVKSGAFPFEIDGASVFSTVRLYNSSSALIATLIKGSTIGLDPPQPGGFSSPYTLGPGNYTFEIQVNYSDPGGTGGMYVS